MVITTYSYKSQVELVISVSQHVFQKEQQVCCHWRLAGEYSISGSRQFDGNQWFVFCAATVLMTWSQQGLLAANCALACLL